MNTVLELIVPIVPHTTDRQTKPKCLTPLAPMQHGVMTILIDEQAWISWARHWHFDSYPKPILDSWYLGVW